MLYREQIESLPMDDSTNIELRQYVYDHIKKYKPKVVVEVGTHKGVTSLWMSEALRENGEGMLYTVDPIDFEFNKTLEDFPELKPFVKYEQKMGTELDVRDIDFVFIDGFHEYENVLQEIVHFTPRLSQKAFILFHDCGGDNHLVGVNRAIDDSGLKTILLDFNGAKSRLYATK